MEKEFLVLAPEGSFLIKFQDTGAEGTVFRRYHLASRGKTVLLDGMGVPFVDNEFAVPERRSDDD